MRLAQYQVWAGREDGKAEPGWDGRMAGANLQKKICFVFSTSLGDLFSGCFLTKLLGIHFDYNARNEL